MRTIVIPRRFIEKVAAESSYHSLAVPVKVDWPELQLTDQQCIDNAMELAAGHPAPHEDNSIFTVLLQRGDIPCVSCRLDRP